MRKGSYALTLASLAVVLLPCGGQVLSPPEILDPGMRALQQKHFPELKAAAVDITSHEYPYKFYLSRTLDITERQEQTADQRSIRFSDFHGRTVLQVTGNYFAAYQSERMDRKERVERTYLDVVMPILRATATRLENERQLTAYAIEISHHVRKKVMGVPMERLENLALIVPRDAAAKAAASTDAKDQIAALHESSIYLDGGAVALWPGQKVAGTQAPNTTDQPAPASTSVSAAPIAVETATLRPPANAAPVPDPAPPAPQSQISTAPAPAPVETATLRSPANAGPTPDATPLAPGSSSQAVPAAPAPARDLSPKALLGLQAPYQGLLDKIAGKMNSQAHFVSYAPPALIAFRNGAYLQLSLATTLTVSDAGSQYRVAALAFDRHISHLIRPLLAYFKQDPEFDGIVFSSTVHLPGKTGEAETVESVEYYFHFRELREYAGYNLTGQQLIGSGFVLVNGERIGLDLQSAEADSR